VARFVADEIRGGLRREGEERSGQRKRRRTNG